MKAWENKIVLETTLKRNASLNAHLNINRKKGRKFIDLFKKKQKSFINKENAKEIFEELEKQDNSSWIKLLGGS